MTLTANAYTRSQIAFLAPEQSVFEAYQEMQKNNIHHLPIVKNGEAVGIISDRDLQFIKQFGNENETACQDIMTEGPYIVTTDTPITKVAQEMVNRRINSALIKNSSNKIIGIFTATDALKVIADHMKE